MACINPGHFVLAAWISLYAAAVSFSEQLPQVIFQMVVSVVFCRGLLALIMRALRQVPRVRALVEPSAAALEFGAVFFPATLVFRVNFADVPEAASLLRAGNIVQTLGLCWLLLSVTLTVLFEGYFKRVRGVHVPIIIKTILRFLFLAAMVLSVLHLYFDVDVSGAAITAASVSIVLGVALKDTLSSLFAGIALSVEGPFQVGDYVKVAEWTGWVVDTNWRTTQLRSDYQDIVTIPNNRIADASIVNFYRPSKQHRSKLELDVETLAPPFQVLSILEEAARSCRRVLKEPKPSARVSKVKEGAVVYSLNFYIADYTDNTSIQTEVIALAWYALRRKGHAYALGPVAAAATAQRHREERTQQEVVASLRRFPIFQALAPEQLQQIAGMARLELWGRGEDIFRQGQPGDSYYVIRSGSVDLLINSDNVNTSPKFLASLKAGAGFGERSLLTGEPRSASVRAAEDTEVFVIDKPAFQGILMEDKSAVEKLSNALAEIQERDRRRKNEPESTDAQLAETRKNLFSRITAFFQLG